MRWMSAIIASFMVGVMAQAAEPPLIRLTVEDPGASPEEIEFHCVVPLESALQGVEGLKRLRAEVREGRGTLWLEFKPNANLFQARTLVAEKIRTTEGLLPELAEVTIEPSVSREHPLFLIAIRGAEQTTPDSAIRMRAWAKRALAARLLGIPHVARVRLVGGIPAEIEVTVSPEKLTVYGLSLSNFSDAIRKASTVLPPRDRNEDYIVRTRTLAADDLSKIPLVVNPDGRPVLLRDVATVKRGGTPDGGDLGRSTILLAVELQPDADPKTISPQVDEVIEQAQKECEPGWKITRNVPPTNKPLVDHLIKQCQADFPPDVRFKTHLRENSNSALLLEPRGTREIVASGDDLDQLIRMGAKITSILTKLPDIKEIDSTAKDLTKPSLHIVVDRERMARLGLTIFEVSSYIDTALEGRSVGEVLEEKIHFDVVVRFARKNEPKLEDLGNLAIPMPNGQMIPLNTVVKIEQQIGPSVIHREDGHRHISFYLGTGPDAEKIESVLEPVKKSFKGITITVRSLRK